jgi:hypothetical protein
MPPLGNDPPEAVQVIANSMLFFSMSRELGRTAEPVRAEEEKLPAGAVKNPPKLAFAP